MSSRTERIEAALQRTRTMGDPLGLGSDAELRDLLPTLARRRYLDTPSTERLQQWVEALAAVLELGSAPGSFEDHLQALLALDPLVRAPLDEQLDRIVRALQGPPALPHRVDRTPR